MRGQLIQPSTFMLGSSYKQFMHDKLNMKVFCLYSVKAVLDPSAVFSQ